MPYTAALCCAHASVEASRSTAMTRDHFSDRAKAMVLPPAPAKRSMMVSFGGLE